MKCETLPFQNEGVYVCTASNGVGHPAMATVDVNILCKY